MTATWPAKTDYATGNILTAAQMNAIGEELNYLYTTPSSPTSYGFAAGKNAIINGDFGIWQRGTSGTSAAYGIYAAPDRFAFSSIGGTSTISRQTFTPGTAPVSGYEGTYYCQIAPGTGTTYIDFGQAIEDVRIYAGQTVTFSFWAKATSSIVLTPSLYQNFGSGGSTVVQTTGSNITLTSSWVRYTSTITLPSISGKTIGTNSCLSAYFITASGTVAGNTISIWGVQLEAGSSATSFQTATGTKQGELAACQRYFQDLGSGSNKVIGAGRIYTSTSASIFVPFLTSMRTTPSLISTSGSNYYDYQAGGDYYSTAVFINAVTTKSCTIQSDSISGATAGQGCLLYLTNASSSLSLNAEL